MANKKKAVLCVLLLLTVAFIFGHSMVSRENSAKESSMITEKIIQPIEEFFTGQRTISHAVVRKWAHGIEYAVLGAELVLLCLKRERKLLSLVRTFSYAVGVALLDETIQIFSGRGPGIRDVWIDALGASIGILVTFAVLLVRDRFQEKREETQ